MIDSERISSKAFKYSPCFALEMSIDVNEYVNDIWSFVIYDDTYWSEIYAKFKSIL